MFIIENGDAKDIEIPKDVKPVVRFKSKISGNTTVKDLVQGDINISNSIIEDFVILRQDGSPTYQLSATVDDHSMKVFMLSEVMIIKLIHLQNKSTKQ